MEQKPIQCPNCKSENVVSTVTYRKAPVIRVFKFICIAIFLIAVAYNIYDFIALSAPNQSSAIAGITGAGRPSNTIVIQDNTTANTVVAGISIIFAIFFEIAQQYYESKACILYLCKDCDHTWKEGND